MFSEMGKSQTWLAPTLVGATTQETENSRGAYLYQTYCSVCHGEDGDGKGQAARFLDPRPRDFHVGKYRLISSGNLIPFREDIVRSIREGIPGTSMPAWRHLPSKDVELLADYVFSITKEAERQKQLASAQKQPESRRKAALGRVENIVQARTTAENPAQPGPQPAVDGSMLEKLKPLYMQSCAACHGEDGSGMRNPEWRTEEGHPIVSRNFRSGIYKGGGRGEDIYRRIYAGIPGTPMPGFNSLTDEEIWGLVHYVQSLAGSGVATMSAGKETR
jgi:mono/diheme cytochrome c family protein